MAVSASNQIKNFGTTAQEQVRNTTIDPALTEILISTGWTLKSSLPSFLDFDYYDKRYYNLNGDLIRIQARIKTLGSGKVAGSTPATSPGQSQSTGSSFLKIGIVGFVIAKIIRKIRK